MATTNVRTHSGNRIAVLIDGVEIGLIQSLRMNDSYGLDAASGVGDIHVHEHVPSVATHQLSVSNMVLKKENMRSAGLIPENGEDALKGVIFDIVTSDKDTGQPIRKYIGCSYDSGDLEIQKHQILVSSASLKALDVAGTGA